MPAHIISVSRSTKHEFSKDNVGSIRLVAGLGIEGDAHLGETVQHLFRVRQDPSQPNLRQVHLLHAELFDELAAAGFQLTPGEIGENVTTRGIDLLGLPHKARLHLGDTAMVEVTGLRNPCRQIEAHKAGLLSACLARDVDGNLVRKSGIMGIVLAGGEVKVGDAIRVELPDGPHQRLPVV